MEEIPRASILCEQGCNERLYILFVDGTISSALLILENQGVKYIAMLDSTGISRGYTQAMAVSVIRGTDGLVVCFSHPKDELVFRKTELKKVMGPRKLFDFWKHVFRSRCKACSGQECYLQTWSNFESGRRFPYKSLDEIRYFPDDPKSRLIRSLRGCAISLRDLFDGLLVGADFAKGGLIFSFCSRKAHQEPPPNCIKNVSSQDVDTYDYGPCPERKPDEPPSTTFEVSLRQPKTSEHVCGSSSRVEDMIETLRQLDFSTPEAAQRSSKDFVTHFKIVDTSFQPLNCREDR